MHARLTKFDRSVVYIAFVVGLGGASVQLAEMVGKQAVRSASSHLVAWRAAPPSRAEQRLIEVATIVDRPPAVTGASVFPDAPAIPLQVLAAQMDLSETNDVKPAKRGRRARLASVASTRPVGRSAADEFGRNFGVLLMASR